MKFPAGSIVRLIGAGNKCFFAAKRRQVDLSDTIMLHWPKISRTAYLGLQILGKGQTLWDETLLQHIESEIRNDLTFDAYRVQILRVSEAVGEGTDTEFVWRMRIRG